eukprot:scaffold2554_cov180-Alexandrium_tamarense.AAC.6
MASNTITSSKEATFHGVIYRKTRGTLTLTERGLLFKPEGNTAADASSSSSTSVVLPWTQIEKHQVSPASHAKHLLKVIASSSSPTNTTTSYTFAFLTRNGLESARRDITIRLAKYNPHKKASDNSTSPSTNKKRSHNEISNDVKSLKRQSSPPSSHFVDLDPVALIATRSSLLASDPALRAQHRLLVLDNGTLSEEDFWETHSRLIADEYAKMSGKTNRGMSSDIKSSLDLGIASGGFGGKKKNKAEGGGSGDGDGSGRRGGGIVHLGVEEMRQIFLMYPSVHKAYEEKVPLELSEEQFWRKYLESEYFHRDRGRIGAHIGRVNERERLDKERFGKRGSLQGDEDGEKGKGEKKNEGAEDGMGEDEAKSRLAAAGTDDIFSRYERSNALGEGGSRQVRPLGTHIAVGQFDLASTAETERGERFLEGNDLHPPPEGNSQGARVIDKYNRHWAIVLHPNDSTAGVDLAKVAAASATDITDDDEDAKVNGGCDREMYRLVGFANASENDADHSRGVGDESEDFTELTLRNVGAYTGKFSADGKVDGGVPANEAEISLKYAKYLAATMRATTEPLLKDANTGKTKGFCFAPTLVHALPEPKIGRGLLEALTKKMAADSQTDADVQRLADTLPVEFRTKLASYFRRSSELLRHFFSLRSVFNDNSDGNGGIGVSDSQKSRLTSIVTGMEKVHGEMYDLTRNLPLVESKMFKPIMDQLDYAFKLHREDSSKGGGGGFVTVAKGGFVPVKQF